MGRVETRVRNGSRLTQVLHLLPPWVEHALAALGPDERVGVEEIRISQNQPLMVTLSGGDRFITPQGVSRSPEQAYRIEPGQIAAVLDAVTQSSVYALEDALKEGYLTLPGGHRVGIAGMPRMAGGDVRGFRHITGFNIRLNRPVYGVGRAVAPAILRAGGSVHSTLIVSPPGCGKTTLLRDLVRLLSEGCAGLGIRPHRVGVADERSEIAGAYSGAPQNDLGPRTDVIDACPKRLALPMLIRAMRPEVVATDEIGHPEDAASVLDARAAGVVLICTAHGESLHELKARASLRPLWESRLFGRIVILSRREGPGTIERVVKGGVE